MKNTYRVLFYIRKTKSNKDGSTTIAILFTINREVY